MNGLRISDDFRAERARGGVARQPRVTRREAAQALESLASLHDQYDERPATRAAHPESARYLGADGAAEWQARCAGYQNAFELKNSWARHSPAFRAAGVLAARRSVSALRLLALTDLSDEGVAVRLLDDAEAAADAEAHVAERARRTRKSATAVRREMRDEAERRSAGDLAAKLREVA